MSDDFLDVDSNNKAESPWTKRVGQAETNPLDIKQRKENQQDGWER